VFTLSAATLVVKEVADSGVPSFCDGADYVELKNIGPNTVDPSGYMLTNNDGLTAGDAFRFPAESDNIDVGEFLVLCKDVASQVASFLVSVARFSLDWFTTKRSTMLFVTITVGLLHTQKKTSLLQYVVHDTIQHYNE
jgi:hypothetical protein